jgi:predicted membrane metal-binding protein
MNVIKEMIQPLLVFLLGIALLVLAALALVLLGSLLFHGIPWVWNL